MKLQKEFYLRDNVVQIAKELLGKFLFTKIDNQLTGGIIVETEAYMAPDDKASHAYNHRKTARTEIFYNDGGLSYVYLCYGIHHLFNVITNTHEHPHAILIRAIEPIEGVDVMLLRRKKSKLGYDLTSGPGSASQALGITTKHNAIDLTGKLIWIEDRGIVVPERQIIKSPRVGIDYAEEWVDKPWRFRIKDNPWTSKAK
jgi:DNA-3-methyladenine glycosylase